MHIICFLCIICTFFIAIRCTYLMPFIYISCVIITKQLASAQSMYVKATAAATAANKVTEKAKESMDMSTKHVESMQESSTKAQKEVEDAQAFLAEAEKRHEVIEITDDDDTVPPSEEGAGGKKRKVSLSPQISSSNVGARDTSNNNNNNNSTIRLVEQLVVEGCGLSAINGTYKRSGVCGNGFPLYERDALWMGSQSKFLIAAQMNHSGYQTWGFSTMFGNVIFHFYSTCFGMADVAPRDDSHWMAFPPFGISPSPHVKRG